MNIIENEKITEELIEDIQAKTNPESISLNESFSKRLFSFHIVMY